MTPILLIIPTLLLVFGIGYAYAEPLEDPSVTVLNYDNNSATVKITWNHDVKVTKYEIGCVSCMPSMVEFTSMDNITLNGVTAFPKTSNAMLYMIAYDLNDEIIRAKQIFVNIK